MPPFVSITKTDLNTDQIITITIYEVIATIGYVQPAARIFYELDCSGRMSRELSVHFELDGQTSGNDKPGDWRHVPPEGNAANLLKLLCPAR